jgi:hypothetical protein
VLDVHAYRVGRDEFCDASQLLGAWAHDQ